MLLKTGFFLNGRFCDAQAEDSLTVFTPAGLASRADSRGYRSCPLRPLCFPPPSPKSALEKNCFKGGRGLRFHWLPLVRVSSPSQARLRGPSAPLGRGHAPVPRMWQLRQHMSSRFWTTLAPHQLWLLWPCAGASGPGTYEFNPILRQPLLGPPSSSRRRHAGGAH